MCRCSPRMDVNVLIRVPTVPSRVYRVAADYPAKYGTSGFRCMDLPDEWNQPWKNCDPDDGMPPCGDGFVCQETRRTHHHHGKPSKLCVKLPECAAPWRCCEHVDCCGDYECVTRSDGHRKRCEPKKTLRHKAKEETTEQKDDDGEDEKKVTHIGPGGQGGGIRPNGKDDEWKDSDFLSNMYLNGVWADDPDKVLAKVYTRVDCEKKLICVLIKAQPDYQIQCSSSQTWFKDLGYKFQGGRYRKKGGTWFIRKNGKCIGAEACYTIPNGLTPSMRTQVEFHAKFGKLHGGSVFDSCSTGKQFLKKMARQKMCD